MIQEQDINCIYLNMPTSIKAYTILNSDMTYTIVLNTRLSHEQHLLSYQHELKHILNGDIEKKVSTDLIEVYAHI